MLRHSQGASEQHRSNHGTKTTPNLDGRFILVQSTGSGWQHGMDIPVIADLLYPHPERRESAFPLTIPVELMFRTSIGILQKRLLNAID